MIKMKYLYRVSLMMNNTANCSQCGKLQDRFLFVTENSLLMCVECWLKDAQNTVKKNNEIKSNDYRTKYFSGNNSFNTYFNY